MNFPISRRAISNYPDLVDALARVKQASARANRELGVLDPEKADIIDAVCERIVAGEFHDQFVVGVIQGGAGTSTNMNVNEVIANAGLEAMGHRFGEYEYLNPIDDVNRSQSTNDVYPTAIKLAMVFSLQRLLEEHRLLTASFAAKGREFAHVLKVGRTQLQDAVPMTLGQEFAGFATTLARGLRPPHRGHQVDERDQHGRDRDRHRHHRRPAASRRPCGATSRTSPASPWRPLPT